MQARERERERQKEVDKRMTPQQTIRHAYISTLKKLGFEEEKGQLREWMTVARDRAAWGQRVESYLDLSPGSFTNSRTH